MKVNLTNKLLISAVALSSCGQPAKQILHQPIMPVVKSVDTFHFNNINNEKCLDLVKNIAEFFGGNGFTKVKVSETQNNLQQHSSRIKFSNQPAQTKTKKKTVKNSINSNRNIAKAQSVKPVDRIYSPTVNNCGHLISGNNISYAHATQYVVPKGASQRGNVIASANGVSLYRLQIENPDIDFTKPVPAEQVIKIPERYVVNSGSVKSFEDVVNTTGIDRHYINDILICIEGRHQKPDLVCKSDGVKSKEYPNGCPTIGFGHTGRVDGQIIKNGITRISEEKAYELLAQDILDAKLDAIVYMGKSLFNSAPRSVQTGIIDIVFNKGVEAFSRKGSPTMMIKDDLTRGDYASAAAHTVLKTGNRGLKKRNVYRVIMSTENLNQQERDRALTIARPHYIETLSKFASKKDARHRAKMQQAWKNAQNGITYGFFN